MNEQLEFDIPHSEDLLKKIQILSLKQIESELAVDKKEKELAAEKENLRKISEEQIPELMAEAGISEIKLEDGSSVKVRQTYHGRITPENEAAAFEWLRANGHGDLIKQITSVEFGRGDDARAQKLSEILKSFGYEYESRASVHSSTLSAFIREQVEAGANFPMETFKAFIAQKTVIK